MARPPPTKGTKPAPGAADAVVLPKKLVTGRETGTTGSGLGKGIFLLDPKQSFTLQSLSSKLRSAVDDSARIRILARVAPDGSNAVSAMIRTAKTKLTLTAYDPLGQVDPLGQQALSGLQQTLFGAVDYTEGFNPRQSLDGLVETLLREVPLTGATAAELVLDKNRMPSYVAAVSPSTLKWAASPAVLISAVTSPDAYKPIPYQIVMGRYVYLDQPNFFYTSFDQDPTTPYAFSPLEPAIMATLLNEGVNDDVQRVVRQTGHSRLYARLMFEQLKAARPDNVRAAPPEEQEAWYESQRQAVDNVIKGLAPEDGITAYDYCDISYLNSEIGSGSDYAPLLETMDGRAASALKVPPAVLAKRMAAGSQNTSSTEALVFLLLAEALQAPVAALLSRLFTLSLRLLGVEGEVRAQFAKPSLRPDIELEAFRSMYQTNVLNLLSLGFYTDNEAAQLLGTGPLSPDATPLSGTRFMPSTGGGQQANTTEDPTTVNDPISRAVSGNKAPTDTPQRAGKVGNK